MLTNQSLVYFAQNLIGAPYWTGASCVKATSKSLHVYRTRFPENYILDESEYERHILEREIVTDALGLIKGFAWNNGGQEVLESRGTDKTYYGMPGTNGCPDKTGKGLLTWSIDKGAKWGPIETIPELPGVILIAPQRIAIYEGHNKIIEANKEAGKVIYEDLNANEWRYWFCLPFIEYINNPNNIDLETIENKEDNKQPEIIGTAIALEDVISKDGPNENSKFLNIIPKNSLVKVYNDSSEKWLHLIQDGEEKYSFAQYFLIYPFEINTGSKELPSAIDKHKSGWYKAIKNLSIRDSVKPKSKSYVNVPKGSKIYCTGGYTGNFYQVCVQMNNSGYLGYVSSDLLERNSL